MSQTQTNPYANGLSYYEFRGLAKPYESGDYAPDTLYMRALYAQAYHETGGFSSTLWNNNWNMFGMRPSQMRHKFWSYKTTGSQGTYAGYNTHLDGIYDRIDLDSNFNRNTNLNNLDDVRAYMEHVKLKGYATDPQYVPKWTNVYNQIFTESDDASDDISYGNGNDDGTGNGIGNGDDGYGNNSGSGMNWKFWIALVIGGIASFLYIKRKKK